MDKIKFKKTEITYIGHTITENGFKSDNKKVEAIVNMQPPTNTNELKTLLGMASYLSKFIPDFANIVSPLRELNKKDI